MLVIFYSAVQNFYLFVKHVFLSYLIIVSWGWGKSQRKLWGCLCSVNTYYCHVNVPGSLWWSSRQDYIVQLNAEFTLSQQSQGQNQRITKLHLKINVGNSWLYQHLHFTHWRHVCLHSFYKERVHLRSRSKLLLWHQSFCYCSPSVCFMSAMPFHLNNLHSRKFSQTWVKSEASLFSSKALNLFPCFKA